MYNHTKVREALGIDAKLLAIDPYGCGCTECLVGDYLPQERMEAKHVIAMSLGVLSNHTGYPDPTPFSGVDFAGRTYSLTEV